MPRRHATISRASLTPEKPSQYLGQSVERPRSLPLNPPNRRVDVGSDLEMRGGCAVDLDVVFARRIDCRNVRHIEEESPAGTRGRRCPREHLTAALRHAK